MALRAQGLRLQLQGAPASALLLPASRRLRATRSAPCTERCVASGRQRQTGDRTASGANAGKLCVLASALFAPPVLARTGAPAPAWNAITTLAQEGDELLSSIADAAASQSVGPPQPEQVESFSRQAAEAIVRAYDAAVLAVEAVVRVSRPVVEAAAPVVKDAARSALDAAAPAASQAGAQVGRLLQESGVDVQPVVDATKVVKDASAPFLSVAGQAVEAAKPVLSFLQSQTPQALAAEAGGLFLLYLASPFLLAGLVYTIRGYAGNVTAAQALDKVLTEEAVMIDVRREEQKEASGVPSFPRKAKKQYIPIPVEDVTGKLRPQLKNPKALEAELTAIKIACLKRLNKRKKLVILDSNGDLSKDVARCLSALGFRNAFAVTDGVDGRRGWANSSLTLDFYGARQGEIVLGGLRLPTGTSASTSAYSSGDERGTVELKQSRPRLLLPSGKDE